MISNDLRGRQMRRKVFGEDWALNGNELSTFWGVGLGLWAGGLIDSSGLSANECLKE